MTNPFINRREADPQGLIDDLLAQTTRQATSIYNKNNEIGSLKKTIEKLEKEKSKLEAKIKK